MKSHPGDESLSQVSARDDSVHSDVTPQAISYEIQEIEVIDTCRICESWLNEENVSFEECTHRFCKECMRDFILEKIGRREVTNDFHCPAFQCVSVIPQATIDLILHEDEKEKLNRFRYERQLESDPYFRWCPAPDCQGFDRIVELNEKLMCGVCGFSYCGYCLKPWHEGQECSQNKDKQMEIWLRDNNGKFCPSCRMRVEKNEGCPHMTCINCGYEWCWRCGESYHRHEVCIAVISRHWSDFPLSSCLLVLFLPLISPCAFIILVFISCGVESSFRRMRRMWMKIVTGVFLVLLGLVVTPFGYIVFLLFSGHIVLIDPYQQSLRRNRIWGRTWRTVMYMFSGVILNPFVVILALGFVAISPVIGLGMLALKFLFSFRQKPEVKSPVSGYPVT